MNSEKIVVFENLEEKFNRICNSAEWKNLADIFKKSKRVYLIGNGGLHYVAEHAAADCTRLIPGKVVETLSSNGLITSIGNDDGYENLFLKYLEKSLLKEDITDTLVIGLSCSGNSKNITRALSWAKNQNASTFMISGKKSKRLDREVSDIVIDCDYFHTAEVIILMLFYQMIHEAGSECPTIDSEIKRKDPWAVS